MEPYMSGITSCIIDHTRAVQINVLQYSQGPFNQLCVLHRHISLGPVYFLFCWECPVCGRVMSEISGCLRPLLLTSHITVIYGFITDQMLEITEKLDCSHRSSVLHGLRRRGDMHFTLCTAVQMALLNGFLSPNDSHSHQSTSRKPRRRT